MINNNYKKQQQFEEERRRRQSGSPSRIFPMQRPVVNSTLSTMQNAQQSAGNATRTGAQKQPDISGGRGTVSNLDPRRPQQQPTRGPATRNTGEPGSLGQPQQLPAPMDAQGQGQLPGAPPQQQPQQPQQQSAAQNQYTGAWDDGQGNQSTLGGGSFTNSGGWSGSRSSGIRLEGGPNTSRTVNEGAIPQYGNDRVVQQDNYARPYDNSPAIPRQGYQQSTQQRMDPRNGGGFVGGPSIGGRMDPSQNRNAYGAGQNPQQNGYPITHRGQQQGGGRSFGGGQPGQYNGGGGGSTVDVQGFQGQSQQSGGERNAQLQQGQVQEPGAPQQPQQPTSGVQQSAMTGNQQPPAQGQPTSYPRGDWNKDGKVDGADATIEENGDFNQDGKVDASDQEFYGKENYNRGFNEFKGSTIRTPGGVTMSMEEFASTYGLDLATMYEIQQGGGTFSTNKDGSAPWVFYDKNGNGAPDVGGDEAGEGRRFFQLQTSDPHYKQHQTKAQSNSKLYGQGEAAQEQQPDHFAEIDKILGGEGFDPDKMEAATRADYAKQQARAIRAQMEMGAYAGVGADAQAGSLGDIQSQYGVAANRDIQNQRAQVRSQQLQAALTKIQMEHQLAVQRGDHAAAQRLSSMQAASQAELIKLQNELSQQITGKDILGAAAGGATGLAGLIFGL